MDKMKVKFKGPPLNIGGEHTWGEKKIEMEGHGWMVNLK